MSDRELSPEEIEALSKPRRGQSFGVPGTNKRVKFDPTVRTVSNWFKLPHTVEGECEIPSHDEERTPRNKPRSLLLKVEGMPKMCRWCFVEERDKIDKDSNQSS